MTLEAPFFAAVRKAGFDSVRIPIRWSAHTLPSDPKMIDPKFFERVDWAVKQALDNDLAVVLNFHHYEELYAQPDTEVERFLSLWRQVATHFADRTERVVFEILNEPHAQLDSERWNALLPRALGVIRESNPKRIVIVGPSDWNGFRSLPKLQLPEDPHLIVTFHYYEPFHFTHQGAPWAGPDAKKWLGTRWSGNDSELAQLRADFDTVAKWSKENKRPIYLGEFGAFEKADMHSRSAWTAAVASEAERRGFAWAYWEFGSGFGAYDRSARAWRIPLLQALIPPGRQE
jgi:endoglucanase